MAEQAAAPAAAPTAFEKFSSVVSRMMLMWFVYSTFFRRGPTPPPATDTANPGQPAVVRPHANLWPQHRPFEVRLYVSEDAEFDAFDDASALQWTARHLSYTSDLPCELLFDLKWKPSAALQNNGTLFAHVYAYASGRSPDPKSPLFDPLSLTLHHQLNQYLYKKSTPVRKSLLGAPVSSDAASPPPASEAGNVTADESWRSYWSTNLTVNLIADWTVYPPGSMPPQISKYVRQDSSSQYFPVLTPNTFWVLREHLLSNPINDTVTELTLHVEFSIASLWKWQLAETMQQSLKQQDQWSGVDGESDEFKRMLLETNVVLLGVTLGVSLLHTLFSFLAFKNDIAFWKAKRTMEGMSVHTMFLDFACQVIIFLYLVDTDTSFMILASSAVGLCIEAWKISRAVLVEVRWRSVGGLFSVPTLTYENKADYVSTTKELDDQAMKYLSWALYPCVSLYFVYSLIYEEHKGWYSFVLSTLVGAVYTFGFIMMCPQLFINMKLKTVAHLPWRAFTYKFLNTIVDDCFAFVIKMPTLHRLSFFRDDVIFLIILYQRYIYPVDPTRTNEFGQSGDETVPAIEDEKKTQ